jgi:hypothetical protein
MFVPADPRFDELLKLAQKALGPGLDAGERARWRELTSRLRELRGPPAGSGAERRRYVRAEVELRVEFDEPPSLRAPGTLTSTLSGGGFSVKVPRTAPSGTPVKFVLEVEGRAVRGEGQVAWAKGARDAEIGIEITAVAEPDREAVEALVVRTLLADAAVA